MNGTTEQNPLLSIAFEIPFPRIQAAHVAPAIRELIQRSQHAVDRLGADTGKRTYENTMLALENATEVLDWAIGVVRHLESTATTPELRAAYNEIQPEVSEFYSGIPLHPGLWRVLKEFAATQEALVLKGARKRFVDKTIENFRRNGADLDDNGKKKLAAIDVELSVVTTKFSENVLDSTNAWELSVQEESKLAGLPPTAIAAARQSAASKGQEGWRFTLQQPSYVAVMTYLDDRAIREQVYRAYATRATAAPQDNRELLPKILELRRAKAELLGVKDFADFVLFDRMAHTGERAESFLVDLKQKTERHFERENAELLAYCRANGFGMDETLQPWDIGYWAEKQRQALYDFDEEVLRPYFALEKVVEGLFATVKKLFAIDVVPQEGVPGWDEAVRYFRILDEKGTFLGGFYTDWYPRENKRGGAWMDAFLTGGPVNGEFHPHLGLMCGNLTPPVDG
ncbi:MAG: M3 family peptidase, partial [Bryobacteraceae bacterium]|nr:M3 family peptidase [Bryobacteraceae bacterium]